MADAPHDLGIADLETAFAAGDLSPVALCEHLLARIAAFEPQLHAFIARTDDLALAQARQAEAEIAAGRSRGAMHGVPFALKDIYNTAGIATTACSRLLADHVPAADATTTAKLLSAGGVLMGKLATHEFAHGGPSFDLPWPPARNPWDTARVTGGSSSGSGAAVAAGYVPLALGSDTGGSIRNPAALCGLVGLKPTYGLVSRAGVVPNSYSFDTCGPLTRTVADAAIALQLLAGHDAADPASACVSIPDYRAAARPGDIRGLRIGIVRHFYEEDLPANDAVRQAMDAAIAQFAALGAVLEDVRLRPMQDYYDVKIVIAESEMFELNGPDLRSRVTEFGMDFLGRCLPACLFSAVDYMAAQRERRRILAETEALYARYDLLLTAGPYGPAATFEGHSTASFWTKPSVTTPFNVTAGPALVQPMGFSGEGMPLSLQLVGRPFDEVTVLRAAAAYEAATDWGARKPPLDPDAPAVPWDGPVTQAPESADLDAAGRDRVAAAARAAGLDLPEPIFEQLCCAAEPVWAMAARLRARAGERFAEPANTFAAPR